MNIRAKIFGGASAADEPLLQPKKPKGPKSETLQSVLVSRTESRSSNNRIETRHRLTDEQARVTYKAEDHVVRLINISGGGAMIGVDFEAALWDRIDLHLGEHGSIECAVRWIRDDRLGLEFAHETRLDCSASEQARLLRDVVTRNFPEIEFGVAEESSEHDGPENRVARRHPLIWSAQLHHDYQTSTVRLRNISETGAMIQCDALLRSGSEPLLDFGDAGSLFATVMWTVGDQAGLRFNTPFDLSQLARSRPEVTPAEWTGPVYLNSADIESSPWAAEWNRMSLGEMRDELEGFLKR